MFRFVFRPGTCDFELFYGENVIGQTGSFRPSDVITLAREIANIREEGRLRLIIKFEDGMSKQVFDFPRWALPLLKQSLLATTAMILANVSTETLEAALDETSKHLLRVQS